MSAANMGISQLECLQLRRLVGPSGIGTVGSISVGSPFLDVNVTNIQLALQPDGSANGSWTSPFTVPSGTGMLRVTVQTVTSGGSALYYTIGCGEFGSTILPTDILPGGSVAAEGFGGWWAEELIMYSNPSSTPAPIVLIVGAQGSTQVATLKNFAVKAMSFGPYVNQGFIYYHKYYNYFN